VRLMLTVLCKVMLRRVPCYGCAFCAVLRDTGMSYVEGFLLCLLVRKGGWSHRPVVLQSISCVGGILAYIRLPNMSMFSVIVMCLLLVRIHVYFVGYVMHR